ncbi:MAG: AAA family ATPase [Alphaproteobacteria bacterium]|nr:AAA family ATPase [Alphaproteobacteria bacterium]
MTSETSAEPPAPLPAERLRPACNAEKFTFETTASLDDVDGLIGQERAVEAIRFGTEIQRKGFNLFVLGSPGLGKHTAVSQHLEQKAADEQQPPEWVYVNNFETSHKPVAIALPPGRGVALEKAMAAAIDRLKGAIPALFESDDYRNRRRVIDESMQGAHKATIEALGEKAKAVGIALVQSPQGLGMAPIKDGEVMPPEAFNDLPDDDKKRIQETIGALQKELAEIMENLPRLNQERRDKIRNINRELAAVAVVQALRDVKQAFWDVEDVQAYLEAVRKDLIDNVEMFIPSGATEAPAAPGDAQAVSQPNDDGRFRRYRVNIVTGDGAEAATGEDGEDGEDQPSAGSTGAPVVYEDYPTLGNLVGRIEHRAQMGALMTDFTLIKPGALHRANGGYLLLEARKLLTEPYAWEALKRALRSACIKIEAPGAAASPMTTTTLEPEPVPLDVKVVLFGDRALYYQLAALDPDFSDLFKVAADFEEVLEREDDADLLYARLLGSIARREDIRPLDATAVAGVIDYSARLSGASDKLSVRMSPVVDLIREADFWAAEAGDNVLSAEHIKKARDQRDRRLSRMRERAIEVIVDETILIDTAGAAVGQINGLSVLQLGDFGFGKPTRITARVGMGSGKVVDIEREVELGGPLHTKGVLILSGFLAARFAQDYPMSLAATLVFEQSYGGVDGDSASSTELYALLSALADVPIKQALAVTGSVNQYGEVQAIGGVNEKIEGFFEICRARGLTGDQGVLIPPANVKNLMLEPDVVEAARAGKFRIHAVKTVDQGIEILTGVPAGVRGADGRYPEGSINDRVERRIRGFAEARRNFLGNVPSV